MNDKRTPLIVRFIGSVLVSIIALVFLFGMYTDWVYFGTYDKIGLSGILLSFGLITYVPVLVAGVYVSITSYLKLRKTETPHSPIRSNASIYSPSRKNYLIGAITFILVAIIFALFAANEIAVNSGRGQYFGGSTVSMVDTLIMISVASVIMSACLCWAYFRLRK
ncbi:hypothetical protein IPL85_03080 [Candidatus Saccharibacteria bacterium]|nr:MAG: hypothetical protein IPL85_03080 [Candidatus Saccharibacteria bacterium]